MVRLASSCAWNVPSRLAVTPCGRLVAASSARMRRTISAMSVLPSELASTTMRLRPFSRRIWFGPSVSFTSAI